jgi:magnesium-transporting ATPase (P-type)
MFWNSFDDPTIMILVVAATISLALGVTIGHKDEGDIGWIEGTAIFIAVLIVALVTSGNNYQKELQFRKLNEAKNEKPVKVIRGGRELEISIYDLLVGDLVKLDTGDGIPADGLLVQSHGSLSIRGVGVVFLLDRCLRPFVLRSHMQT